MDIAGGSERGDGSEEVRCQTHTRCVKSVVGGCRALSQGAGVQGGKREAWGRGWVCVRSWFTLYSRN